MADLWTLVIDGERSDLALSRSAAHKVRNDIEEKTAHSARLSLRRPTDAFIGWTTDELLTERARRGRMASLDEADTESSALSAELEAALAARGATDPIVYALAREHTGA